MAMGMEREREREVVLWRRSRERRGGRARVLGMVLTGRV